MSFPRLPWSGVWVRMSRKRKRVRGKDEVDCRGCNGNCRGLSRQEGAVLSSGFLGSVRPDWHSVRTGAIHGFSPVRSTRLSRGASRRRRAHGTTPTALGSQPGRAATPIAPLHLPALSPRLDRDTNENQQKKDDRPHHGPPAEKLHQERRPHERRENDEDGVEERRRENGTDHPADESRNPWRPGHRSANGSNELHAEPRAGQ